MSAAPALDVRGLWRNFGGLTVARDIDLKLERGARHALIGPNGAGKTTLVNLITGMLRPGKGQVFLNGGDVTSLSQAARVKRGLARTFQINQLFRDLTVLDNVMLAVAEQRGTSWNFFTPSARNTAVVDEAMGLLDQLKIADHALLPVRELPYGRQRLVEIAITLGLEPRVLLLDEPAAGVPTAESHIILDVLDRLPADMAILIIEHDMDVVFRFARTVTVLVDGAVFMEGAPDEIARDSKVRAVYLGEHVHEQGSHEKDGDQKDDHD